LGSQLKEALDELFSCPNDHIYLTKRVTPIDNYNVQSRHPHGRGSPRRTKKLPHKCRSDNVLIRQQLLPIPVIMNRYAPLANLQEVTEASLNLNKISKVFPTRNLKKGCAKSKRKKIVIIGDSHARGIAAETGSGLGKDFERTGTGIPGA
jgi:hypothetical protein